MNNRNRSPLYTYVENAIIGRNVNVNILTKAQTIINSLVTNCCTGPTKTTNSFLKGFNALLKTMPKQYSLNKIKAVKTLLDAKIACCV